MQKQPEFILVTGANATGKTTLIEKNRPTLESAGFEIIIPDDILKYATSHTDVSAVIKEHVDEALSQKKNFVLETPFQFKGTIKTVDQIKEAGYKMSMYQLFVVDAEESIARVKDRFNKGGSYIHTDEVRANFKGNMNNVANIYARFDHAYFIDNASCKQLKLAAEFKMGKLILLRKSEHMYLRELFSKSPGTKKIHRGLLKIIMANKNYPELMPKRSSGLRLKI